MPPADSEIMLALGSAGYPLGPSPFHPFDPRSELLGYDTHPTRRVRLQKFSSTKYPSGVADSSSI